MLVWVAEHNNRFQWLAYIAEECSNKKGGALISAVHSFMHHGAQIAQMVKSGCFKILFIRFNCF